MPGILPKLFTALLCTLSLQVIAHQQVTDSDKTVLLKNVHQLPIPQDPNYVCATYITGTAPQIIATANTEAGNADQSAIIVTSRLGKGKVMVIGSRWYFKQPLLADANVVQFITNTIAWGINGKQRGVQIWGDDADLKLYLTKHGNHVIPSPKFAIDKRTGVIIATKELSLTDSLAIKQLADFVKQGGTFIYGSTLADQFNKDSQPITYFNAVFLQSGMVHVFKPVNPANHNDRLLTGSVPFYLRLNTILSAFKNNNLKELTNSQLEIMESTLTIALRANSDTSALHKKIVATFGLNGTDTVVPTPQHPVSKTDSQKFRTYFIKEKLESNITRPPAYIDPASKTFPGAVADSAVRINTVITVPVRVGSQGLYQPTPYYFRWHSTGLYAPPGEKITVIIRHQDVKQHLQVQIGVHNDDLFKMDEYVRKPVDLTRTFKLERDTTTIYSPFGGILLLKIIDTCKIKQFTVQVNGAVKEPYFKLSQTSVAEWKSQIRNYGAPWAEIASDKLVLTVPAYRIRQLEDPDKLMKFWDEVMDANAKLAAIDTTRNHPERIIVDAEVGAPGAYMFSVYYKVLTPDDEYVPLMLSATRMRAEGSWGHFHELGHRHQFGDIDFEGLGEVTVNLFTMYVHDKVLHKGIYNSTNIPDKQTVINDIKKYMAGKPSFDAFKSDAFLALKMYIELIEGFGWGPIEQVYRNYRAIPLSQYPKTEPERRDLWFIQISNATQKNLGPFFDKWCIPVTAEAKKQVSKYPIWLPEELK